MQFSVKRNLTALYLIKVAKWMNLVMPVIVLFYNSNGMMMKDIFILQAVYSVTLMCLEIPTGYFADVAGRKTSMLLGAFLGFGGYLIYASSGGFWQFVIAETILGVGQSLISGADSAMLYDTLAAKGLVQNYTRMEGRITSIGNFAEALAGIIGGMLALISLRTPFIVQASVAFIAIPAAISLREPPVHIAARKPGIKDILEIVRNTLITDRKLRWNTLFSAIIGASTLTMAWFAQPYFKSEALPLKWYGLVWALLNVTVGLAAMRAWKIENKLGAPTTVILFTLLIITGYFTIPLLPFFPGLSVLLIFYLARGIATPTLRNYINIITTSEVRATVLSVRNFVIRFLFAVLGPFFGWITDSYSLSTAMMMAGFLYGSMGFLSLFFFLKHKTYEAN
jgi:MFS family permease